MKPTVRPAVLRDQIQRAIRGATDYLLRNQIPDGHWEEYHLPVGPSDAWVTAYIGVALTAVAQLDHHPNALAAAGSAASWLVTNRPYAAGWGYNGRTGPDADSTGYALILIRAAGLAPGPQDLTWLLARWRPGGGFATYDGPGAWGSPHVDVTPAAFRALPATEQKKLKPELIEYLRRNRRTDGTWPAYWWRTCWYSTYTCLSLLRDLGEEDDVEPALITRESSRILASEFDLALVLGIAALQSGWSMVTSALAQELLKRQGTHGGWPGGMNLRVTHPGCYSPWDNPSGTLYEDNRGFITTSTALTVLVSLPR